MSKWEPEDWFLMIMAVVMLLLSLSVFGIVVAVFYT